MHFVRLGLVLGLRICFGKGQVFLESGRQTCCGKGRVFLESGRPTCYEPTILGRPMHFVRLRLGGSRWQAGSWESGSPRQTYCDLEV